MFIVEIRQTEPQDLITSDLSFSASTYIAYRKELILIDQLDLNRYGSRRYRGMRVLGHINLRWRTEKTGGSFIYQQGCPCQENISYMRSGITKTKKSRNTKIG